MSGRGSVLILTALMIVAATGIAAAQLQFTQTAPIPRSESVLPKPRQPLFPVQPFALPKVPPAAEQADPTTPVPPAAPLDTLPGLKPRVVCGMTLIPTVPAVDPNMALKKEARQPKNPTTYTIRPVQPSICWEGQ